jgi:hypothetical protein
MRLLASLGLLSLGILLVLFPEERPVAVFSDDTFEDFSAGTLDAGGQNVYVSRDGKVRTINRFDLNNDGHIDLIFNCTHDTYQMLPATAGMVGKGRTTRSLDIAVEGSQRVALGDLDGDGCTDAVFCPNSIGVHHDRRFVSIAWGGPDGWPAQRVNGVLPMNAAATVALADLNHDGRLDIIVLGGPRWRPEQPEGRILRIFWNSPTGFSPVEFQDIGIPGAVDLAAGDFDGARRPLASRPRHGCWSTAWAGRATWSATAAMTATRCMSRRDGGTTSWWRHRRSGARGWGTAGTALAGCGRWNCCGIPSGRLCTAAGRSWSGASAT